MYKKCLQRTMIVMVIAALGAMFATSASAAANHDANGNLVGRARTAHAAVFNWFRTNGNPELPGGVPTIKAAQHYLASPYGQAGLRAEHVPAKVRHAFVTGGGHGTTIKWWYCHIAHGENVGEMLSGVHHVDYNVVLTDPTRPNGLSAICASVSWSKHKFGKYGKPVEIGPHMPTADGGYNVWMQQCRSSVTITWSFGLKIPRICGNTATHNTTRKRVKHLKPQCRKFLVHVQPKPKPVVPHVTCVQLYPTKANLHVQASLAFTFDDAKLTGSVFNWGDGSSTTVAGGAVAEHDYAQAGTYRVTGTVFVMGDDGTKLSATSDHCAPTVNVHSYEAHLTCTPKDMDELTSPDGNDNTCEIGVDDTPTLCVVVDNSDVKTRVKKWTDSKNYVAKATFSENGFCITYAKRDSRLPRSSTVTISASVTDGHETKVFTAIVPDGS